MPFEQKKTKKQGDFLGFNAFLAYFCAIKNKKT